VYCAGLALALLGPKRPAGIKLWEVMTRGV